jgi:hypothetical protein
MREGNEGREEREVREMREEREVREMREESEMMLEKEVREEIKEKRLDATTILFLPKYGHGDFLGNNDIVDRVLSFVER